MIWENKSKILMINKIYIKQCCLIVWSVKNTESKKSKVVRTINRRIMLLSKWEACDSEKLKFKEPEETALLSSLGLKMPLNKIPLLGPLLF